MKQLKKTRTLYQNQLDIEESLAKLPGQDEAFNGKPVLKQYYHSINPSDSRLDGYEDQPTDILSRMALKKLSPKSGKSGRESKSKAGSLRG